MLEVSTHNHDGLYCNHVFPSDSVEVKGILHQESLQMYNSLVDSLPSEYHIDGDFAFHPDADLSSPTAIV